MVWEQYDSRVQGQTVTGSGSDAAVVRIPGTLKGIALSTDGKGRFGSLDPYLGAMHAVAEAARNVAASGAKPLAITNCMNFGNPERPEVMWQFAESIRGMRDACLALETPVTGGNVSFYNETGDSAIWPTPVIGMLGLLDDHRLRVPMGFPDAGLAVYLLGETFAELGGSEFAQVILGFGDRSTTGTRSVAGTGLARPAVRSRACRRAGECTRLRGRRDRDRPRGSLDRRRPRLRGDAGVRSARAVALFSESASRVVVSVALEHEEALRELAAAHGVPLTRLGETGGPRAVFDGLFEATVEDLTRYDETALPRLLGEPA